MASTQQYSRFLDIIGTDTGALVSQFKKLKLYGNVFEKDPDQWIPKIVSLAQYLATQNNDKAHALFNLVLEELTNSDISEEKAKTCFNNLWKAIIETHHFEKTLIDNNSLTAMKQQIKTLSFKLFKCQIPPIPSSLKLSPSQYQHFVETTDISVPSKTSAAVNPYFRDLVQATTPKAKTIAALKLIKDSNIQPHHIEKIKAIENDLHFLATYRKEQATFYGFLSSEANKNNNVVDRMRYEVMQKIVQGIQHYSGDIQRVNRLLNAVEKINATTTTDFATSLENMNSVFLKKKDSYKPSFFSRLGHSSDKSIQDALKPYLPKPQSLDIRL